MPNSALGFSSRANSSLERLGPAQAQFHRAAGFLLGGDVAGGVVGRAFVELHDDVAVEHLLDLHADFGREEQFVAIHRRGKTHAFLADLAALAVGAAERPHLEATAVGQHGLVPGLEAVQATELLEHVEPGAHPQVEGVAQDDLGAHLFQGAGHHALDGAIGAHGHEHRGLHDAVVEGQAAAPGVAFGGEQVELEHGRDCGRAGPRPGRATAGLLSAWVRVPGSRSPAGWHRPWRSRHGWAASPSR